MTPPSWTAGAVAAATVVGLVVVGTATPAPPEAATVVRVEAQPVTGTVQLCPGDADIAESRTEVAAVAVPDVAVEPGEAPGGSGLTLVPLTGDPAAPPVATADERGQTITTDDQASVLVRADGALAPGAAGQTTLTAAGERTTGLAGQPCVEPAQEWWFAAGSGQVGRRATLVLANPSDGAAVVDVEIWTESGPLSAAGTSDLGIPPGGTRTVSVDAVALGSERVALRVVALVGRVGAALVLREVDGADPQGLTWVTDSRPASRLSYVPGLPAFGERTLRLVNPGDEDAIVSLRVLAGTGAFTPVGLEAIDAPAGQVVDVDLGAAGEEAFTLEVSATNPVVPAVLLRQTPASGLGDIAAVGSTTTLDTLAAAAVTTRDGRSSRIVLTALPEPVEGDEAAPGDATASPPATSTASPTPTQSPTATPSPTASAIARPTPTATVTPSASPTESDEPLVDISTPTTEVVVSLVGVDGTLLDENVATLVRGTTETYPVELPEGVSDAWVVVRPAETGVVMGTLETTTTVAVPDPLDPDVEREAFWLDLAPFRASRVTVEVPPVLPDLTVGLGR